MTHLPSCKSDVSAHPHPRILWQTTSGARHMLHSWRKRPMYRAPCPRGTAGKVSLLCQKAMNSLHLRGKLLELLAVILLWFFYSLREFPERAHDHRFLRQRLTTFA